MFPMLSVLMLPTLLDHAHGLWQDRGHDARTSIGAVPGPGRDGDLRRCLCFYAPVNPFHLRTQFDIGPRVGRHRPVPPRVVRGATQDLAHLGDRMTPAPMEGY